MDLEKKVEILESNNFKHDFNHNFFTFKFLMFKDCSITAKQIQTYKEFTKKLVMVTSLYIDSTRIFKSICKKIINKHCNSL